MSKAYAAWSLRRIQETGWEHIGNQGSSPCSNCQVILKKISEKVKKKILSEIIKKFLFFERKDRLIESESDLKSTLLKWILKMQLVLFVLKKFMLKVNKIYLFRIQFFKTFIYYIQRTFKILNNVSDI